MYRTIAIIEKSHIIKEGLTSLFKSHNICKQIAKLESINDWKYAFRDYEPDLVIINPDRLKDNNLDKTISELGISTKIPFIALIYQYFGREVHAMFNKHIFITDTEDIIIGKIKSRNSKIQETEQKLTDREKDVLKLLLKGLSNKEVAEKLIISPHTAITHRKNIIEKTGIRSLAGLAVYAILNNITDMNEIGELY